MDPGLLAPPRWVEGRAGTGLRGEGSSLEVCMFCPMSTLCLPFVQTNTIEVASVSFPAITQRSHRRTSPGWLTETAEVWGGQW